MAFFSYLRGRKTKSSPMLAYSLMPTVARTGSSPSQGARNSMQVSHMTGRSPVTWAISCWQALNWQEDGYWSWNWVLIPHSPMITPSSLYVLRLCHLLIQNVRSWEQWEDLLWDLYQWLHLPCGQRGLGFLCHCLLPLGCVIAGRWAQEQSWD